MKKLAQDCMPEIMVLGVMSGVEGATMAPGMQLEVMTVSGTGINGTYFV